MSKFPYKAVIFDAYGTVLDVYSVTTVAESFYPKCGEMIAKLWRNKQIEYTRLISLADPNNPKGSQYYASFWELTEASLRYVLNSLSLSSEHLPQLLNEYHQLALFPDVIPCLHTLHQMAIPTAILTNANLPMVESVLKKHQIYSLFQQILSVDTVGYFKIMPQTYDLACQVFHTPKQNLLFISSNAWDALGATWYGLDTFWVNRAQAPFEEIGPKPRFTSQNLTNLVGMATSSCL